MSARRRPGGPPIRRGRLATVTALVMTLAVPGIGHLYLNLLARGLVWLIGNIAILLILRGGGADTGVLVGILGALRVVSAIDLLIAQRVAEARPGGGDRAADG